ncbi:Protein transport protein Sec61 subunit gamma [Branchiostoma belcheri]|nr:Protein transport protein Sec61 subunit gamma [Branchiostoma belcheri]
MDQLVQFVEPARQFAKDSYRLVKRCTKPDRKEFQKIAMATAIGFAIMGFIGFFVKLIHIPINNIIVWDLFDMKQSREIKAVSTWEGDGTWAGIGEQVGGLLTLGTALIFQHTFRVEDSLSCPVVGWVDFLRGHRNSSPPDSTRLPDHCRHERTILE